MTKGVVVYGKQDYKYQDIDVKDEPGEEEVLVEIESCGVCSADVKIYHGQAYYAQLCYDKGPIVAGHEFMGRVVKLGPGAAEKYGLKVGDRAVAEQIVPCGNCPYCMRGQYNLCEPHETYGVYGPAGGWAERMIYVKNSRIHKVPDNISLADAAIVEPMACAFHGVNRANVQFGDTVVVTGCGAIGLFMIQGLKLKNPKRIIAIDMNDHRLEIAKSYGATHTINPGKEDVVEVAKALSDDGLGVDRVLDASGSGAAVRSGVDMLRRGGTLMIYSVYANEVSLDWSIISDIKELTVIGGHLGFNTYGPVIDLLAQGKLSSRDIVGAPFKLADFEDAIEASRTARDGAIKVIMTPN